MKIEWTYGKTLVSIAIVSIIWMVIFFTITDMILRNHGVPKIHYKSFLGNDYWLYLLFQLLTVIPTLSFVIASYEMVKNIFKARSVKKHGQNSV